MICEYYGARQYWFFFIIIMLYRWYNGYEINTIPKSVSILKESRSDIRSIPIQKPPNIEFFTFSIGFGF